jgi:hypothetical protein
MQVFAEALRFAKAHCDCHAEDLSKGKKYLHADATTHPFSAYIL